MALTNYERQKRWREKNRVIYNLKRRNARKNLSGGVEGHAAEPTGSVIQSESVENDGKTEVSSYDTIGAGGAVRPGTYSGNQVPSAQTSKDETLTRLRGLVKQEEEKPSTEARVRSDVVGGIYRNDSGGVISKFAWEKLLKMKENAKEGGYTLDEYSQ